MAEMLISLMNGGVVFLKKEQITTIEELKPVMIDLIETGYSVEKEDKRTGKIVTPQGIVAIDWTLDSFNIPGSVDQRIIKPPRGGPIVPPFGVGGPN
jgi:hypothetical protein